MSFHNVQLPDDVEQGATGGPTFQTTVLPLSSGGEQRNVNWSEARHEWEIAYGIQSKEDFDVVRAFFFARRGMANTFRFRDWSDYQLDDEVQGIGDGTNKTFQLIKTYENDGPLPYVRRITRPVTGTVVFKIDGVTRSYSENPLGIYVLTGAAPTVGATVTASCEFDMCVRFNVDKFSLQLELHNAGAIGSLPVIEVRE